MTTPRFRISSDSPLPAEPEAERGVSLRRKLARVLLIAVGLTLWFVTQWALSTRHLPAHGVGDAIHTLTAPMHDYLFDHRGQADALLILSSTVINVLAFFILARAIFGPSIRPFVGLVILFGLRQICQALTSLPPPDGMIWYDPGFPGLLVTYGVSNDMFFSGHTAIAVYGAAELAQLRGWPWKVVGVLIALFEIITVLVLRAHYTIDVFGGIMAALFVSLLMARIGPALDRGIARLTGR